MIKETCQLQVPDAFQFLRQFEGLREEVQTGLTKGQMLYVEVPCRLLLPVGNPSIQTDVNILLLRGNEQLRDVYLFICSVEVGSQRDVSLEIL